RERLLRFALQPPGRPDRLLEANAQPVAAPLRCHRQQCRAERGGQPRYPTLDPQPQPTELDWRAYVLARRAVRANVAVLVRQYQTAPTQRPGECQHARRLVYRPQSDSPLDLVFHAPPQREQFLVG